MNANGGLAAAAQHLKSFGRGDDTMLVHMTPNEVNSLQGLALATGGSLTTNPDTGLPEAGFLKDILPTVLGIAGTAIGIPPWITAAAVGAGMGALEGDLNKGLMAGLGAFGGASLGGALGVGGALGGGASAAAPAATGAANAASAAAELPGAGFAEQLLGSGNPLWSGAATEAARTAANPLLGSALLSPNAVGAAANPLMAGSASLIPSATLDPAFSMSITGAEGAGSPGGIGGFMRKFGDAAASGIGNRGPITTGLAGMGLLQSLMNAMERKPGEWKPDEEDEYKYEGPYVPAERQVSFPTDPRITRNSSEHLYFTPTNPVPGYKPYGKAEGGEVSLPNPDHRSAEKDYGFRPLWGPAPAPGAAGSGSSSGIPPQFAHIPPALIGLILNDERLMAEGSGKMESFAVGGLAPPPAQGQMGITSAPAPTGQPAPRPSGPTSGMPGSSGFGGFGGFGGSGGFGNSGGFGRGQQTIGSLSPQSATGQQFGAPTPLPASNGTTSVAPAPSGTNPLPASPFDRLPAAFDMNNLPPMAQNALSARMQQGGYGREAPGRPEMLGGSIAGLRELMGQGGFREAVMPFIQDRDFEGLRNLMQTQYNFGNDAQWDQWGALANRFQNRPIPGQGPVGGGSAGAGGGGNGPEAGDQEAATTPLPLGRRMNLQSANGNWGAAGAPNSGAPQGIAPGAPSPAAPYDPANGLLGFRAGGHVPLESGSFVVDARTVAELGNGSSSAGQEILARLGGQPIRGDGDGVSDSITASIDGVTPARVARDEVHFSREAVARLGGGNPKKGVQKLNALMKQAERARKTAKRGADSRLRHRVGA